MEDPKTTTTLNVNFGLEISSKEEGLEIVKKIQEIIKDPNSFSFNIHKFTPNNNGIGEVNPY